MFALINFRQLSIVATCALAFAAATSCAQSGPSTSTQKTPEQSAPSTAKTSDSDVARAAATDTVRDYFTALDEVRQDSGKPLDTLDKVATSTQLTADKHLVENERSKKLTQVGDTRLAETSVENINLDNSDPKAGKVPTVTIDVCWDVSDADLVDASGKSVVSPDRADYGWTRLIVANYHYRTDPLTGWRVASGEDLQQPPCSA